MERFRKALITSRQRSRQCASGDRHLMAQQDREDDASRQIALALMEAQAGETTPLTGSQFVEAADVLRSMHEYPAVADVPAACQGRGRARYVRAHRLGQQLPRPRRYSQGRGRAGRGQRIADNEPDYQYLLAEANVYRQEHHGAQALTAFAQATERRGRRLRPPSRACSKRAQTKG